LAKIVDDFISENYLEQIKALKARLGLNEEVPDEIVRGIALIKYGSVDPIVSQEVVVKLAEKHPVPFYRLWRKIMELSGLGATLGESNASTPTPD